MHVESKLGAVSLGSLAQLPSTIYTRFITELTGGYDINQPSLATITGATHITGGGMPSKLGRMLEPSDYGISITTPQAAPEIMKFVQKLAKFSDEEAYGKWHMGSGMVLVSPEPEPILALVKKRGIVAQIIGEVTHEPGIRIMSTGVQKLGEVLLFP